MPEFRQAVRPLRDQLAAVGRAVVVDLLPVARILRQLLVVVSPRIYGRARDQRFVSTGCAKKLRAASKTPSSTESSMPWPVI
jgi:hypothetical protein